MRYVCDQLSDPDASGFQACLQWGEFSYLSTLAITKSQMIEIGGSLLSVAGVCLAFVIIAKAVKLL
ncbi:hypothetical protein F4T90_00875 [Acinetobacter junii]|uniref:hypothetical protein n=1 Tax=Acinetobacter junii TaxID=40215 RepID=UPI0012985F4C|nr:hypothetical protein [Acinetobacter junii]MQZ56009.1 hypothetical protein [Acinetobacter junii]